MRSKAFAGEVAFRFAVENASTQRAFPAGPVVALLALALTLALAACNGDAAHQPFTIAVTTPNGEPLPTPPLQGFDSPGCPAILGTWFDRIDVNHNGVIDRAEFMADAEAQFARMDLNHDGIITPGVLQEYRAGFAGHAPPRPASETGVA